SRMNVGQVLEVHLGWAAKGIGQRIGDMLQQEAKQAELRKFLDQLYNTSGRKEDLVNIADADVLEMAENLSKGIPFATPVFDGASEEEIRGMLKLAYPEEIAKLKGLTATRTQALLYDGRSGDQAVRASGTCMHLVVHQMVQLQHVHVAHRDRPLELVAAAAVVQQGLRPGGRQPLELGDFLRIGELEHPANFLFRGAVEHGGSEGNAFGQVLGHFQHVSVGDVDKVFLAARGVVELVEELAQLGLLGLLLQHVADALADALGGPAQVHFQHLAHVHA